MKTLREKIEGLPTRADELAATMTAEDDDRWIKRADVLRVIAEHAAPIPPELRPDGVAGMMAGADGDEFRAGLPAEALRKAWSKWKGRAVDRVTPYSLFGFTGPLWNRDDHPCGRTIASNQHWSMWAFAPLDTTWAEVEAMAKAAEQPMWRQELERLWGLRRTVGVLGVMEVHRIRVLEPLASLADVIASGKGEAVVPECVALHMSLIPPDSGPPSPPGVYKCDGDDRWVLQSYWEHAPGGVYENAGRLLAAIDSAGSLLCPESP
jgi:hypothetical protein